MYIERYVYEMGFWSLYGLPNLIEVPPWKVDLMSWYPWPGYCFFINESNRSDFEEVPSLNYKCILPLRSFIHNFELIFWLEILSCSRCFKVELGVVYSTSERILVDWWLTLFLFPLPIMLSVWYDPGPGTTILSKNESPLWLDPRLHLVFLYFSGSLGL